uniref:Uncharacterized protein n=1 Tax=Arundo donax TaxID=35708 RepID=A0A0A9A8A0_ARUDO
MTREVGKELPLTISQTTDAQIKLVHLCQSNHHQNCCPTSISFWLALAMPFKKNI